MAEQALNSSDELYGIAKRINRELDGLQIHSHGAIVEMVKVGFEHRNMGLKKAFQDQQVAQQERALKMQEQQMALAKEAAAKRDAKALQPHLVEAGPPS